MRAGTPVNVQRHRPVRTFLGDLMIRKAGLALSVAVVAPLAFAPVATSAELPPTPIPAPGLPPEVRVRLLGLNDTPAPPVKTTRTMTAAQYRAQKLAWSPKNCTAATKSVAALFAEDGPRLTVECATVKTPLSWDNLRKGSINLHVTRVRSTGTRPRTLFVNPGGPGEAAGPMSVAVAATVPALRKSHQIVAVDPRGTGGSSPLSCPVDMLTTRDSRDVSAAARRRTQQGVASFVRTCVKKQGKYLPYITTTNTVADQDLIRTLMVGKSTVDWYGVSAGTWMGAWFAQRHPSALGRVVIDANTEYTADWRTTFSRYAGGFQRRFEGQFLPWLARQDKTFMAGRTPKATKNAYERIRAAAGKGKVAGMVPDDVDGILSMLMYDDSMFPVAGRFIGDTDRQLRKTGKAVPALPEGFLAAGGDDTSSTTVRTAILCNDGRYTRTQASYEAQFRRDLLTGPLTAGGVNAAVSPCASWPYKPLAMPAFDASKGPMKLMLQTQYDPATPIEGAWKAHAADKKSRLVVAVGQGSHGAFNTDNRCIDTITLRYLQTGRLPARDTQCAGNPLPGETKVFPVTWR